MAERQPSTLWAPWSEREARYDIPSVVDLQQSWCENEADRGFLPLEGTILGAVEAPVKQPTVVLSIDLYEVVRKTGASVPAMRGGDESHIYDAETNNFDYGASFNGWSEENAQPNKQLYIQEFMHHDLVEPAQYTQAIQAFLLKWRNDGAYVIANTSTLPGCEISTIKFLQKHYPDCFQGILFPRNHDGNGTTTKAEAIGLVRESVESNTHYNLGAIETLAIEDAPHHARDYSAAGIKTFLPAYDWNEESVGLANATRIDRAQLGTLATFIDVANYLSAVHYT